MTLLSGAPATVVVPTAAAADGVGLRGEHVCACVALMVVARPLEANDQSTTVDTAFVATVRNPRI